MEEFIQIATSFPTVVFTGMMGLTVLYWLFVVVGALDIDVLDFDLDFGGIDGADGALDGAADAAAEAGAEAAFEAGAEAAAEAAGEAAAEAASEAALEGGVEVSGFSGVLIGLLSLFRLRKAPITVSLSFFSLYAWLITFLGVYYLAPLDLLPRLGLSSLVFVGASTVALGLTSFSVQPLGPLFVTHIRRGQETLVGKVVTVQTQTVTKRHGQAKLKTPDGELILSVRCESENGLTKGGGALIIDYDQKENIYHVEPMDNVL